MSKNTMTWALKILLSLLLAGYAVLMPTASLLSPAVGGLSLSASLAGCVLILVPVVFLYLNRNKTLMLILLSVGLALFEAAAILNGMGMNGRLNLPHHAIRVLFSVCAAFLYWRVGKRQDARV